MKHLGMTIFTLKFILKTLCYHFSALNRRLIRQSSNSPNFQCALSSAVCRNPSLSSRLCSHSIRTENANLHCENDCSRYHYHDKYQCCQSKYANSRSLIFGGLKSPYRRQCAPAPYSWS